MQPHCSYFVCATPQSGSMLLCEALKKTSIAGWPKEYFDGSGNKTSIEQPRLYTESGNERERSKLRGIGTYTNYLARVIEEGTSVNGIFGANIMWDYFDDFVCSLRLIPSYSQMPVTVLLQTIFPNLHYIWMTRRNKVQHAIALWRALQRRMWMLDESLSPRREPMFHFEVIDRLVQQIVTNEEEWWKFFEACSIEPFTVVYEELANGIESTVCDVLRYLHIPITNDLLCADWRVNRQADALSEEWVKRYHVLKQAQQSRLPV
jgi:trehalose 2-sulfotransferase